MNKELLKELHKKLDKPRPRPLMFCGYHNGKKVYVRKRSLTYWQLREKYPPLRPIDLMPKPRHIFQKQHHLKPIHLREAFWGYVIFGGAMAFAAFVVIIYAVLIIRALL